MNKTLKNLFILVGFGIAAVGCFLVSMQSREGERRTEELHRLTPEMISGIEVYGDESGRNRLEVADLDSSASKALFAESMHDIADYRPSHDQYRQRFFVRLVVTTGQVHEFSIGLKSGVTGMAFIRLVQTSTLFGRVVVRSLGTRESAAMYRWLAQRRLIK